MNLRTKALLKTIQLMILAIGAGVTITYALTLVSLKWLGVVAISTFTVLCGYIIYLNILSQLQCQKEQESYCQPVDE